LKNNHPMLKTALLATFITIFGLSGIRDFLTPALYWVVGCLPLSILGIMEVRARGVGNLVATVTGNALVKWMALFWLVFIAGIVIASVANGGMGFMAAAKYFALGSVFVALCTFLINTEQVVAGLKVWAAVAVVGVIGLFLFDVTDMLVVTPGRIGWILALPGVLWKAGLFLLVWLVWQLLMGPLRPANLTWLFLAALIMGFDGSRTGILVAAGAFFAFLFLALIRYKSNASEVLGRAVTVALFIVVGMGVVNPSPWSPMHVLNQYSESPLSSNDAGSGSEPSVRDVTEDSTRVQMLGAAVAGSIANFPLGGGFGSTGVPVEGVEGLMVVHITYLQLLSDVGVIGLVGYLGIFAVPLVATFRRVVRAEDGWLMLDRFSLPLCILMCYLVVGLLHPVSSELSEWAIVLLAFCLLIRELPASDHRRSLKSG